MTAKVAFTVEVYGNWCSGYFFEIKRKGSERTIKSWGPYESQCKAFEDGLVWCRENDYFLESEENPYAD